MKTLYIFALIRLTRLVCRVFGHDLNYRRQSAGWMWFCPRCGGSELWGSE